MTAVLKKGVVILVLVFVGYYLLKDPVGMGNFAHDAVSGVFTIVSELFQGIIRFFDALTS